jgi:hypothetical protein
MKLYWQLLYHLLPALVILGFPMEHLPTPAFMRRREQYLMLWAICISLIRRITESARFLPLELLQHMEAVVLLDLQMALVAQQVSITPLELL